MVFFMTPAPAVPSPANVAPPPVTSTNEVLGNDQVQFARADHTHPSRVQRGTVALDANGEASWMFNMPFDDEPNIPGPAYREAADNMPIIIKVKDFFREKNASGAVVVGGVLESAGGTGKYTGLRVKGQRLSNTVTPALVQLLGVSVMIGASISVAAGSNLAGIKAYLSAAPNS